MAKANIITKQGTKITVEGDAGEVAAVISQLEGGSQAPRHRQSKRATSSSPSAKRAQKTTPVNLVSSLIDGGFFRKPKDLGAVKTALEELGHFYPVTTLSPALLRLVRKRQLRRIKEKKRWLYTRVTENAHD
jgi:hypothetical protein